MGATVRRRRHLLVEIVEVASDDDGAGRVAPQVTIFACEPEGREVLEVVDLTILRSRRGEHHVHVPVTLGRSWDEVMEGAGVVDPPRASEPSYASAISQMLWRLRDAFDEVL